MNTINTIVYNLEYVINFLTSNFNIKSKVINNGINSEHFIRIKSLDCFLHQEGEHVIIQLSDKECLCFNEIYKVDCPVRLHNKIVLSIAYINEFYKTKNRVLTTIKNIGANLSFIQVINKMKLKQLNRYEWCYELNKIVYIMVKHYGDLIVFTYRDNNGNILDKLNFENPNNINYNQIIDLYNSLHHKVSYNRKVINTIEKALI